MSEIHNSSFFVTIFHQCVNMVAKPKRRFVLLNEHVQNWLNFCDILANFFQIFVFLFLNTQLLKFHREVIHKHIFLVGSAILMQTKILQFYTKSCVPPSEIQSEIFSFLISLCWFCMKNFISADLYRRLLNLKLRVFHC